MGRAARPASTLRAAHATVDGARVEYFTCGTGDPLVFVHGWGLTPRAYGTAITGLTGAGVRLIAPTLPGFGGSDALPRSAAGLREHARRVAGLIEEIGVDHPVFLIGHSLGGGVALRLAHDRPDLVRSLTLLNSVGGAPAPAGASGPASRLAAMTTRPWWRWAAAVIAEADPRDAMRLSRADTRRLMTGVVRDFLPNAVRRPLPMLRSAWLALNADLAAEAQGLVDSGLPVLFVWGDRDRLITPGAFSEIVAEVPPEVVRGRHAWLLTAPEEFTTLLRNSLVVHAMLERRRRGEAVALPPGVPLAELIPAERRHRARPPSSPTSREAR